MQDALTSLSKPRKRFGPEKPCLVLYLQTEKCTRLSLLARRGLRLILRICEKNGAVIVKFEYLLWLSRPDRSVSGTFEKWALGPNRQSSRRQIGFQIISIVACSNSFRMPLFHSERCESRLIPET